jgi:hypothetical protein
MYYNIDDIFSPAYDLALKKAHCLRLLTKLRQQKTNNTCQVPFTRRVDTGVRIHSGVRTRSSLNTQEATVPSYRHKRQFDKFQVSLPTAAMGLPPVVAMIELPDSFEDTPAKLRSYVIGDDGTWYINRALQTIYDGDYETYRTFIRVNGKPYIRRPPSRRRPTCCHR